MYGAAAAGIVLPVNLETEKIDVELFGLLHAEDADHGNHANSLIPTPGRDLSLRFEMLAKCRC